MKGSTYIREPLVRPLIKRKAAAKLTKDITKLSTLNIARFLYQRHRAEIWITGFWALIALQVWLKLG